MEIGEAKCLFVVPQDPAEREFILAVDRVTKSEVDKRYGIIVSADFYCTTIANSVLETCLAALAFNTKAGNKNSYINFYDMFNVRCSLRSNSNAEKEGNINVTFEPGERAIELISDPNVKYTKTTAYEAFTFDDPDKTESYLGLDRHARYELSNKYSITISDKLQMGSFAITYVFFESIFKELLYRLTPEEGISSINFMDNIEIHATYKDGGVIFTMRPGYNAKLIVKSDETTEEE